MDEPALISLRSIFDELQRMEARLGDKIEGRCGGLEPIFDEGPVFDAKPVVDAGPVLDEEPIFDEGPACIQEPGDATMIGHDTAWLSAALHRASSASTTDKELVLNPIIAVAASSAMEIEPNTINIGVPANCSMKFPNLVINGEVPVPVYTAPAEVILNPILAAAASTDIVVVPSNINTKAPSTCSTKCPSLVLDITSPVVVCAVVEEIFVAPDHASAPLTASITPTRMDVIVYDKIDVTLDIKSGDAFVVPLVIADTFKDVPPVEVSEVVLPVKCADWQPWPGPMPLEVFADSAKVRPMPWPHFIMGDLGSAYWCVSVSLKLPWPLPSHTSFSYATAEEMEFQKFTLGTLLRAMAISVTGSTSCVVLFKRTSCIHCMKNFLQLPAGISVVGHAIFLRLKASWPPPAAHNYRMVQVTSSEISSIAQQFDAMFSFFTGTKEILGCERAMLKPWDPGNSLCQDCILAKALHYLKQRKCGGIPELSWLVWICIMLKYSADRAIGGAGTITISSPITRPTAWSFFNLVWCYYNLVWISMFGPAVIEEGCNLSDGQIVLPTMLCIRWWLELFGSSSFGQPMFDGGLVNFISRITESLGKHYW